MRNTKNKSQAKKERKSDPVQILINKVIAKVSGKGGNKEELRAAEFAAKEAARVEAERGENERLEEHEAAVRAHWEAHKNRETEKPNAVAGAFDKFSNWWMKNNKMLHPDEEGEKLGDYEQLYARTQFSNFLPYNAYDADTKMYFNSDETVGWIWECSPVVFLADKQHEALMQVLKTSFPKGAVLQATLIPDEHIDGILDTYKALKTRPDDVIHEAAKHYADHLSKGRDGFEKMGGIRAKNFRLFVSIKTAEILGKETVAAIVESLQQAGLYPRPLAPGALLNILRRIFNKDCPDHSDAYNPAKYIKKQIIRADSPIEVKKDHMIIGGRYAACLTPKEMPPDGVDTLKMNKLLGGYLGPQDDNTQLNNFFIWNTTIVWSTTSGEVKKKGNIMMGQKAGGSIAKTLHRRVLELDWVLDDLETDEYCDVITSLWVFGENEDHLNQGRARAKHLWNKQKFTMQQEDKIMPLMLINSLPFGFRNEGDNLSNIDRHFPMSAKAAALMLPVQADFAGGMKPVVLMVGRKGQLAGIDLFDEGANAHNFLTCAATGAGKSFVNNFLVQNYYATGAKMRITDIGYSYEKQCMNVNGRFIDVGDPKSKIVLNPFVSAAAGGSDADDKEGNVDMAANIILAMIYSNTNMSKVTETEYTLVKEAVNFAYRRDGGEYGVNHVCEFLANYPKLCEGTTLEALIPLAHELAYNLREWTTQGEFGTLVNGPGALDLSNDDFVVLEMDKLVDNKSLFTVVSMQVINAITQDLYLSDRTEQRFMLFDEAWKYLGAGDSAGAQSGNNLIAGVIAEGYRRARKYLGATGIITQSPLDLAKFGPAGEVIKSNSAFKFFLECEDYPEAVKRGILDYSGLHLELAKSIKNQKPRYSEILFETPFGAGVSRLHVDPFTYWMNTSTGHEVSRFKKLLRIGLNTTEAMQHLSGVKDLSSKIETGEEKWRRALEEAAGTRKIIANSVH